MKTSLEDLPISRFHQLLTVRSGGGWLLDGYVLSILGVALVQFSAALQLNSFWEGMVAASALIGIFFGGFLGGWSTKLLGRKKLYLVGPVIFTLCSIGQYFATSGMELFIYRFLIGIGVGFEYTVAGSLLVEYLPAKSRGPRLAALTILWFAGAALAYIVGHLILNNNPDGWRWVLASPAAIGIILILIRLGAPESPRWLVSQGRIAEADAVIKQVYGNEYGVENLSEQPAAQSATLGELIKAGYGKRLVFCSMFWMCSVVPVFAVYAFAPRVLHAMNLTGSAAAYGSVAITVLFVIGCAVATYIINIIGRRPMVIHSFLWSGLALLGLGLFSDANEYVVLVLFGLYALFIGGAQVLQLVYPNEIFPTEIRSIGVGIGASMSRIGAAIGTWVVPVSLASVGIGNTMLGAAAVTLLGLVISVWLAPETRGMSLEEAASLKR